MVLLAGMVLSSAAEYLPKIGLQTWTVRNMTFEQAVDFAVAHHFKYVQFGDRHIDPKGPVQETMRKKALLDKNGLIFYTFGVAGTSNDKEENRKLFEFAKLMGIKMIVVEPRDMAQWDNLEQLVKEYDIKLAIHNHGITSTYGNPEIVRKVLASRDRRIGVCLDLGHLTGAGFDAARVFDDYDGRVYDIHLKDKKVEKVDGKDVILDVEIGDGQSNYKGLLAEMAKVKWNGVMAVETDNDIYATNPAKFVDGAVSYIRQLKR
ncbi:MAG TPA: sugar phosphate isomerase/epimerase [Verrucomicrobiae bacterium]|nr:sugar phosphate isomerase/epimerase [Verrucomicrobiae bacterium]